MLKYSNQITIHLFFENLKNLGVENSKSKKFKTKGLKRSARWNNPFRVIAKSRVSHSVTGSRGYTTRPHNAATRFRWASRPNPRKTRLLSANWYRALTQFRSGGPCRGGLSRVRVPPRGETFLCPSFCRLRLEIHARKVAAHFGHGSWRILRSAGVISLKDSPRFTDRWSFPSLSQRDTKVSMLNQTWGSRNRENPLPRDSCKWIIVRIEKEEGCLDFRIWNKLQLILKRDKNFSFPTLIFLYSPSFLLFFFFFFKKKLERYDFKI